MRQEAAPGLRERQRRERRESILDAAGHLFNRLGYDATPIEAVAERAGVSAATVYNYFGSKLNIIMALARRHQEACQAERLAFVRNPPADPVAAVRQFTALLLEQSRRLLDRDCWRVIYASFHQQPGGPGFVTAESLNATILVNYQEMLGLLAERGLLRRDSDTAALSQVLLAIMAYNWRRFLGDADMTLEQVKEAVDRQVVVVLRGLVVLREARD